jgi:hypothetical protein
MAIDESKLEYISKALCLFVLSIYLSTQVYVTLRGAPSYGNVDALAKSRLIRPSCLLLLGGSNARHAFSAEQLSTVNCPALNLAVSSELGSFDRYMAWLGARAGAETVIYSTFLVLSLSPTENDGLLGALDHVTPLASRLKQMLSGQAGESINDFTSFGDQVHYACNSAVRYQYVDLSSFERTTPKVVVELTRRVALIKQVTGASKVVLHTPRIYISDEMSLNQKSKFQTVLDERLVAIRNAGIGVLDTPVVHSDKDLFCDSSHASPKGRDLFTVQLKERLVQL